MHSRDKNEMPPQKAVLLMLPRHSPALSGFLIHQEIGRRSLSQTERTPRCVMQYTTGCAALLYNIGWEIEGRCKSARPVERPTSALTRACVTGAPRRVH